MTAAAHKPKTASRPISKQTSVNLTMDMRRDIERIAVAKYGPRGLSRWIEKSLASFMKRPDYFLRVGAGEANIKLETRKAITLTADAEELLDEAVSVVRRTVPTMENVRAMVLRAAFSNAIREAKRAEPDQGNAHQISPITAEEMQGPTPKVRRKKAT